MATDKKITDLPVASAINAADNSILVSNNTDYQFDFTTLLQFINAELAVGANLTFGNILPQNTTGKNGDVFINTATGSFAQKLSGTWTLVYTPITGNTSPGTILYGSSNPGAATGNDNDTYINTVSGVFYKKTAGAWNQVFSMQTGPQGIQGAAGANGVNGTNGKTIWSGSINPANSQGTDGDFYINTASLYLFGPKVSGVWGTGVALISTEVFTIIPFHAGDAVPFIHTDWIASYAPTLGNGSFLIQFKEQADDGTYTGNLQDRPDIGATRIIDRTGAPVQTGFKFNNTGWPDGQLVIKHATIDLI